MTLFSRVNWFPIKIILSAFLFSFVAGIASRHVLSPFVVLLALAILLLSRSHLARWMALAAILGAWPFLWNVALRVVGQSH